MATIESVPKSPQLTSKTLLLAKQFTFSEDPPVTVVISIVVESVSSEDMSDVVEECQVERYVSTTEATRLIRDWMSVDRTIGSLLDEKLRGGLVYGYRVRWRDSDGEVGPWSDWALITP